MKRHWKPLLILVAIVVAAYFLYPSVRYYRMSPQEKADLELTDARRMNDLRGRAINLGLDLQGGIHLVMEVDVSKLPESQAADAVDGAQEVIRNRIDQFGVAEPIIQREGTNRIIVELPGVQDVQRAKNLIGRTALLEFKLVEPVAERNRVVQRLDKLVHRGAAVTDTAGQAAAVTDTAAAATAASALFAEDSTRQAGLFEEAEAPEEADGRQSLKDYLGAVGDELVVTAHDLPVVKALLASPEARKLIPEDVEFVFTSKPEGQGENAYHYMYLVRRKAEMTGGAVGDAFVSVGQDVAYLGQPIVNFITTDEGVRVFSRVTGAHVNERLAIILDGAVYSAPVIQTRIRDGRSIITGSRTQEEAKDLSIVLRAGALPAQVEIIEDRTVGPSLGRDSIDQGKRAVIYSFIVVALMAALYYRGAGLVADVALGLNLLFTLAVLAAFHATLTLPGVAGIVLTIGMAVDANVLTFERIREELRAGKSTRAAIEAGFNNAWSAIIDSNVTTLLAGIVLYQFGTGPIRGFALTLCIGIVSTLFSAVFISRTIFELLYRSAEQGSRMSIGGMSLVPSRPIDFMGMRRVNIGLSVIVILAGAASIATLGLRPSVDFTGGTLLELHFDPAVSVAQVRDQLSRVEVGGQTLDLTASEIKQFGSPNDILVRVATAGAGSEVGEGIAASLKSAFPGSVREDNWVRRHEKVGPKIGSELRGDAIRAALAAMALTLVYIAWRFRQFTFGIGALIATFHDVAITVGLLSMLRIEMSLNVVAGILTLVGYSLNDTIVVFDRIRENLHGRRRQEYLGILNVSINETLSRTVITGMTTLASVLILIFFGGDVNRNFAITLLIGIIVGTYSSVFIATPILYVGHQYAERREKAAAAPGAVRS